MGGWGQGEAGAGEASRHGPLIPGRRDARRGRSLAAKRGFRHLQRTRRLCRCAQAARPTDICPRRHPAALARCDTAPFGRLVMTRRSLGATGATISPPCAGLGPSAGQKPSQVSLPGGICRSCRAAGWAPAGRQPQIEVTPAAARPSHLWLEQRHQRGQAVWRDRGPHVHAVKRAQPPGPRDVHVQQLKACGAGGRGIPAAGGRGTAC